MGDSSPPPLRYRDAGVDIDRGNRLVDRIKPIARRTYGPEVLSGVGGFASLFRLPLDRYRRPVLVTSADGVGTKLRLAVRTGNYETIGIDLVAMCANDVVAHGAEPVLFLDYLAMGRFELGVAQAVIEGIADGCELAGAALVGGESAEMPGVYLNGDIELAGFCVGLAEEDRVTGTIPIQPGDCIIGLASNGLHANGYSLVRKILDDSGTPLSTPLADDRPLGESLLAPTRIYVAPIRQVLDRSVVKAFAHITGGGLVGNLARIVPSGLTALLHRDRWPVPPVLRWVQEAGRIEDEEMHRTFNCGIGMTMIVSPHRCGEALDALREIGEEPRVVGSITLTDRPPLPRVIIE